MLFFSPIVGILMILGGIFLPSKLEKGLPKKLQSEHMPVSENVFQMIDKTPLSKLKGTRKKRTYRRKGKFT